MRFLLILGFLLLVKRWKRAPSAAPWPRSIALAAASGHARRIRDGVESVVPLEEIQPADSVLVLPGERFRWMQPFLKAAPRWTNRC